MNLPTSFVLPRGRGWVARRRGGLMRQSADLRVSRPGLRRHAGAIAGPRDVGARMATDAGTGDVTDRFSLVGGGPFDALLDRFGLIGADQLPTWRAAVVMALLAWMPPAALP